LAGWHFVVVCFDFRRAARKKIRQVRRRDQVHLKWKEGRLELLLPIQMGGVKNDKTPSASSILKEDNDDDDDVLYNKGAKRTDSTQG
jgi:hypothetical protein